MRWAGDLIFVKNIFARCCYLASPSRALTQLMASWEGESEAQVLLTRAWISGKAGERERAARPSKAAAAVVLLAVSAKLHPTALLLTSEMTTACSRNEADAQKPRWHIFPCPLRGKSFHKTTFQKLSLNIASVCRTVLKASGQSGKLPDSLIGFRTA